MIFREMHSDYYEGGESMKKPSKAQVVGAIAMIIGFIGTQIANKSDDMARDEMKAELKEEILSELSERESS